MAQTQKHSGNRLVERLLKSGIRCRPVDGGSADWALVDKLVQRVYVEELGHSVATRPDTYDRLGTTYLAFNDNQAIGTARIICQSDLIQTHLHQAVSLPRDANGRPLLPMEPHFSLCNHIPLGEQVAEAGRFMIHPDYRRSGVALALMATLYLHSESEQLDRIFCLINLSTKDMYERCGYQALAEPRYVARYRQDSVPIVMRTDGVSRHFAQMSKALQQAGVLRLATKISKSQQNHRVPVRDGYRQITILAL